VIISRRTGFEGHAACMGEIRHVYKNLIAKPEGRIKQVQPTAFITSGFNTPNAFHPQEAIISDNKLGSIHINMLHTLSQNILVKLYIFKMLKYMIKTYI
jgi:hypothetical protein